MHDLLPRPVLRHIEMQARALQQPAAGCTYDDLAQEATSVCWHALGRYDAAKGASVATFLRAHGTWAMVDALRAATHYGHVRYTTLDRALPDTASEQDVLLQRSVRRAVNRLPSPLRYVIIKRYFRGWTQGQVAHVMHLSPSRTCQLERQARDVLRQALAVCGGVHD